jgi:tetratricopeptide (TPR) repeat protein
VKSQFLVSLALLLATGLAATPQADKKPLTQDQVMELVRGSVPSSRVADLVRERGISFEPTEEFFRALRSAGAEPVLLDALGAARTVKSPAQDVAAQAKQHIKAANALMDMGDIDGAIVLYQKAIQVRPGDAEAHRLLGVALGRKKDWQRDIAEQRMAIQLDPDDAAAKAELAGALHNAEAEQATRDEPHPTSPVEAPAQDTNAQAQQAFAAGQVQVGQRKFEAAAISFSEAAQLRPDWAEPLVERAKVYMKLYLFREAIHSYDQADKLKPNDPVILNLRGYAYYSASEFKRAVADFDEAIRLNPNMSEAYQNRGNAKWQMGDKAGANMDFANAKRLGPGAQAEKNRRRR